MMLATRPNAYSGSPLDRCANRRDDAAFIADALARAETLFVPVWRSKSLLRGVEGGAPEAVLLSNLAAAALGIAGRPGAFLGVWQGGAWDGRAVFAVDLSTDEDPATALADLPDLSFTDLRAVAGLLPGGEASVLAHARGMMHWRTKHGFCGVCGGVNEPRSAGHAMACTVCGAQNFPRTDPAVIMLVTHGTGANERVLLAHNQRFPMAKMYSTLAGFVEPGETLEEAVAREVHEEAGVRVRDVRYHSSQPWPFPSSIMLGFYAVADDDGLTVDGEELIDARWFSRADISGIDALGLKLPRLDSIARRLIEDWMGPA